MKTTIKMCGLSTPEAVESAIDAGADMIGLVFFEPSPRHVDMKTAWRLAEAARGRAEIVALSVDASNEALSEVVRELRPDWLQLHGQESRDRAVALYKELGVPCMKAIGIASRSDLTRVDNYKDACERVLLDAKAPRDASRPGGLGASFDWTILADFAPGLPWMLSGGLNPKNVAAALSATGALGVDVSSGVEITPGTKSAELMETFVAAVRAHDAGRAAA